jgi:hypothetical protein
MKPYKRKPGEFEIRILPDGRVFMSAPDDALLEVARVINQAGAKSSSKERAKKNERTKTHRAK